MVEQNRPKFTIPARKALPRIGLLAAIAAGLVVLAYLHDPYVESGSFSLGECFFHRATGLHCPGCGGTRAFFSLFDGNFAAAFSHNAFTMSILPYLLYIGFSVSVNFVARQEILKFTIPVWIGWTLMVFSILFGILRNIPCYPFLLLAP